MAAESVCCSEGDDITQKLDESEIDINFITEHEGFEPVCLNVWFWYMYCKLAFSHTNSIMEHVIFSVNQSMSKHSVHMYNIVLSLPIGMTIHSLRDNDIHCLPVVNKLALELTQKKSTCNA